MLEGLVAWVLNNYLGKYVENLNTDQLSIALLSGEVELENLPLKKNALRHLGLPIEIKSGFIGKVKLQIPVRQIRSAPWIIIIERLYLVATPLPVQEWDAVLENLITQEIKLSALDTFEAKWRFEKESKDNHSTYYASTYSSWLSYGTGFITDIIENLQLRIHDVHLRYEDIVSIPNKAVAVGITMDTLAAQTCDENWCPKVSQCNNGISYKLLEMQKLAVYWTEFDGDKLLSKMNLNELANLMSTKENNDYCQHYILSPVSAHAHIRHNCNDEPLRSFENPRFYCDLQLEDVPLTLVDWQYDQIVQCIRGLDDIARLRSYRKFKPVCSIKEDARAWWLYAISCHYPDHLPDLCRPRPTWESCLQKAKENVLYVKTYTKILMSPNVAITPEEKQLKEAVEWNREFEELKVLRELCMRAVPLQSSNGNAESSAGRSMLVGWFPQWMGWRNTTANSNTSSTETSQLEGEILQALSNSIDNNTVFKRDDVFGKFNFTLKSGTLSLCTRQQERKESVPMLELQFRTLCLNIVSKPRTSTHMISLSLGALYLRDKFTINSLFPVLIGPPGQDRISNMSRSKGPSPRVSLVNKSDDVNDCLFYVSYEKRPENTGSDYKLCIRTKSLDVVYQPAAMKWLGEFLCMPHQKSITQMRIESMKLRTKKELMKNWENILDGHVNERKIWEYQLDITAPQIFFVERFCDSNSSMAVIDFGRLQLRNNPEKFLGNERPNQMVTKESEDDEMFMTPCSTPPVSEESDSDSQMAILTEFANVIDGTLTKTNFHNKIYDRYCVELTDLQILIGKVKDNWRYAHSKGTSTLHVLDRFNISMQIERRVIQTADPLYPSLTLNANLPKLVAHLNEYKVSAARTLARLINATGLPSPFSTPETKLEDQIVVEDEEDSTSFDTSIEMSRLLTLQFTVDNLALEVQSRGRSVAELQVAGVKAAFTKRPMDVCITLTVHSLLLVDALQTFGPDFELLVASHKHVGMDSMSGSLRDSEPTSPTSPGSPDPNITKTNTTSPVALTQALSTLASSPPNPWLRTNNMTSSAILDAEALISIEVLLITGAEPMQIANIQFNNLDIIANQETIVELMGFVQRVFPEIKTQKQLNPNLAKPVINQASINSSTESLHQNSTKIKSTQLTFDFHRLNVLLLRGVSKDGFIVGRKIGTATMTEAKIQATVETAVVIEGSLGGLQVLDLTPEGHMHQRIIGVGKDPLLDTPHPLYVMSSTLHDEEKTAFSFRIIRHLENKNQSSDKDDAEITIRMASLWYTHSPQFLREIQSCATEFKQYLSNLARSIRLAATDMALGLVHARAEALAQSLYMNSRLSASLYGSALSFSDFTSPRRRRRSSSMEPSYSGYSSAKDSVSQTPYSPTDDGNININIKLDIILDTPVVVVPRASNSTEVFVAHLGKITVNNSSSSENNDMLTDVHSENYKIEIRDMKLFSLDTLSRRVPGPFMARSEILYSCDTFAKAILHDTMLQLNIERETLQSPQSRQHSLPNLLLDDDDDQIRSKVDNGMENFGNETFQITGSVVNALKLSLTRLQYEQVLDTINWLTYSHNVENQNMVVTSIRPQGVLGDISEEDTGVTTLNMDPHVRAKLFPAVSHISKSKSNAKSNVAIKVCFELPIFSIELMGDSPIGEQGLVNLSFGDFIFVYEKCHKYETNIQVSLRSILMEDLLQPEGSKQRTMVVSSSADEIPNCTACVSKSCPDIFIQPHMSSLSHGSLPDHLEPAKVLGIEIKPAMSNIQNKSDKEYPFTPPPSPSFKARAQKNLVIISTLIVDSNAHNFKTYYNSVHRSTSIDFNCLDLVVNVESWVVVIDFFSASPSSQNIVNHTNGDVDTVDGRVKANLEENIETNVTVRSLTAVLVKPDKDIARANISNIELTVKNNEIGKEVEGKLGSMSLYDLTLHGRIYREKFLTTGEQALYFYYTRHTNQELLDYDSQLKIKMPSVMYIHTKRFVVELQAFFNHFTQLQSVMSGIRAATTGQNIKDEITRMSFVLEVDSPILILPVSSKSHDLLIGDFGELKVTNCFKYSGDNGTISVVAHSNTGRQCLMDVMYIDLRNVDICTGIIENDIHLDAKCANNSDSFKLGSYIVKKSSKSLLTRKCELKLQLERNLESSVCHNVPDMSVHGELSTLDASLDLAQYRLIRGLLTNNLGENTEHILPSVTAPPITAEPNIRDLWTLSSLRIDLLNVTVRLINKENLLAIPLACINFIKSKLTIESFSNLCQDIDLVSQEILITDTRFDGNKVTESSNVFTNIIQPIKLYKDKNIVQVEIHSRKRLDKIKFTILLNNMRLMAIFDWWVAVKEFILGDIEEVLPSPMHQKLNQNEKSIEAIPVETKLNITDSEIVVFEDSSQWDSNAVILKSTTVLTYRPNVVEKPLSCNLNHCEMYSCILGMEEETALSIIDPVTLNMEIKNENVLEVQLQTLTVRLSYNDMQMFMQILNSLPKQIFAKENRNALIPADIESKHTVEGFAKTFLTIEYFAGHINKLTVLGFETKDCIEALQLCDNKLDDAALWLTQNANPIFSYGSNRDVATTPDKVHIKVIEVKANNISLCVIDDCGDADLPILEVGLSNFYYKQYLESILNDGHASPNKTIINCILSSDYYNRILSGWEPIIEPWECILSWDYALTSNLSKNRLQLSLVSRSMLNINITSALTELYKQVKDSWLQDYYTTNLKSQITPSYKRRSPFVPFAIRNETGSLIFFRTLISDHVDELDTHLNTDTKWIGVSPGEVVPFSFKSHDKTRHGDSHKMKMHQICVKIDGYQQISPITVDKVGVYFRSVIPLLQKKQKDDLPPSRIVFDVALEGKARKLVTVRSALLIVNKLNENLEIKLESQLPTEAVVFWSGNRTFQLPVGSTLSVPLTHAYSLISVKPLVNQIYTYSSQIAWEAITKPNDYLYELRACHTSRGDTYRFCAEIKRDNYPTDRASAVAGVVGQYIQPAHTITLLPTVLLVNLLPVDLSYKISGGVRGQVVAGRESPLTFIDANSTMEFNFQLENFASSNTLIIPPGYTVEFNSRIRMKDNSKRRLFLNAVVTPHADAKLKITVTASYWIINKTGLPLVFKQGGVPHETAGQFDEHEVARMVAPLLFSFSDPDASTTVVARVGSYVIQDGTAQFCKNFHLQRGVQVRRLHVSLRDGRPDTVFIIGIEVCPGRGKYRSTNIVTISPRFQLHNKSSYELYFAQSCFVTNLSDPTATNSYLKALSDCFLPFHWPALDKEQLLSVLIKDVPNCCWSGGLKIETSYSMHVNVRDLNGRMYFLRLEVMLQGATYFIIFTDADTMPPPMRIDNFSEVAVTFAQNCCKEIVHSKARSHASVPYAWDQPTGSPNITVIAPGGISNTYDINILGEFEGPTYENFIYIAFTGTFKNSRNDPLDVENQELVLDVINENEVILARKQQGQRSQLWRMTPTGQLQHEGSSPPSHSQHIKSNNVLILDIEGPAPQPSTYTRLMLRRPDPRRQSTQTWHFTNEGRLCCAHYNMCVQAQDGFFGLRSGNQLSRWRKWNSAVLGLPQPICYRYAESGIPIEQAVSRQRLHPGSGVLSVDITMDGPTKVLSIRDEKDKSNSNIIHEEDYLIVTEIGNNVKKLKNEEETNKELQFTLNVEGIGISLISRKPAQELIYAQFTNIVGEILLTSSKRRFCVSIGDIQIDNQLFQSPVPVFLYVTPPNSRSADKIVHKLPALEFNAEMQPIQNENAIIFKHFIIKLKKLTVFLEERLLLQLFAFIGYDFKDEDLQKNIDECDYETQRMITEVAGTNAKRYYFGVIHLSPDQIRLSMKTATKLPKSLYMIRKRLGYTFIKFEDAGVDLEPFERKHLFDTSKFLVHSIIKHFKDELMWQAGIILGSVDFLGNPLGFVADVREGVTGLINDGNVSALVKNVAHGLSNSAAKVTESLSDGLGRMTMDDEHEEIRQRIRHVESGHGTDHLVAGFKGLGFGILGGATGIFKQVYVGASTEGLRGAFSGLGKGVVGALAKPVVGVLDLASETARAVRDTSRNRIIPERTRLPRCVFGHGGLLPRYSHKQSLGQQYLHNVNNRNYEEQLISYEVLKSDNDLRIIISNQSIRIVTITDNPNLTVIMESKLSELEKCKAISASEGGEVRHYIELLLHIVGGSQFLEYQDTVKRPIVRCETADLAKTVSRQINYAKRLYDERLLTLVSDNITQGED